MKKLILIAACMLFISALATVYLIANCQITRNSEFGSADRDPDMPDGRVYSSGEPPYPYLPTQPPEPPKGTPGIPAPPIEPPD